MLSPYINYQKTFEEIKMYFLLFYLVLSSAMSRVTVRLCCVVFFVKIKCVGKRRCFLCFKLPLNSKCFKLAVSLLQFSEMQ